ATVLDRSLRLLHPVMPHLTEELWSRLPGVEELGYEALAVARYPQGEEGLIDPSAVAGIELLQAVVTRSRALRKERNLKRQTEVQLFLEGGDGRSVLIQEATLLQTLGGVSSVREGKGPEEAARDRIAGLDLAFAVAEEALSEDAKARLEKELEAVAKEISGAEARLSNPGFLDKAPAQVVEGSRARLAELRERREALERTLGNVG
ncbi:MAG: class I tRNA ligase family protein, partial [Acidobacteriota bacterium]